MILALTLQIVIFFYYLDYQGVSGGLMGINPLLIEISYF